MFTTYKKILNLKYKLSPSQLNILDIPNNKKMILVRDLLDRELNSSDKGNEVGSKNYISKSSHHFIRAKALQPNYFLPFLNNETAIAIRPQVSKNFNLREGDLIISKDANVGEVIILGQDYPNHIISSALYRLPITKKKLYLLAFLKHHYFREQLDLLVPKGSTIRHAKTLFLDCKIPLPNQKNADEIIRYVEMLTQALINKEKEIRSKNQFIFKLIKKELSENQKEDRFEFKSPKFSELFSNLRIDSGYYCSDYKQKKFSISNYSGGFKPIEKWGFEAKRGQNLTKDKIGERIFSDKFKENFYVLIKPNNSSEFGTVKKLKYLGSPKKLSPLLKAGDVIFSVDRTIGKCIFFNESKENYITDHYSVILRKENYNIRESAFVACFLRFLRDQGVLNYISVGGQGGNLAQKY